MSAPQLQLPSGELNRSVEGPEDVEFLGRRDLPTAQPAHLESALPPVLARRVVEVALSLARPVRCHLAVEGVGGSVSIDLPLKVEPEAAPDFRLRTPDSTEDIEFVLNAHPDGQATLNLNVRYAGLPVGKALSYARFLRALYGREGILYLTRLEPEELKLELLKLPLPLDQAGRSEVEDRVRFLETLEEIDRATGAGLVHPSEVSDEDLRDINYVLKVIRSGWVAQRVTDFTTPLAREGVENVLNVVDEQGEVLRAFAMTSEYERRKVFGSWVDLGPSIRYVAAARLLTPRADMERWLDSKRSRAESFEIRWAPEEGVLVNVFYHDWPQPSLAVVRRNLKAFEEEYGMDSDEFRRAWETGEPHARDIEEGDIWLSFLEAREALEQDA